MTSLDASLSQWFGLSRLHDAQVEAITALEEQRDVLVRLPTGYGKSLCYQLPALRAHAEGRGSTLVVSPLVALMDDQVKALHERGLPAVAIHGSLRGEQRTQAMATLRSGPALIYASPERLQSATFRRQLKNLGLAYLAVDEAHCIAEWGHDFRPEYRTLGTLRDELDLPCIALTATATQRVAEQIRSSLGLLDAVDVYRSIARPNLRWEVELIDGDKARAEATARILKEQGFPRTDGRAVVYVSTRKRTRSVAMHLRDAGLTADWFHAGRTIGARQTALERYESGRCKILVATTAFGMGMDRPDVRAVIHAEAPGSLEAYLQQAGRAGRDGEPARCTLLYAAKDALTQKRLWGASPGPGVQGAWAALVRYATGESCRQSALGLWFGETLPPCGHCDACDTPDAVQQAAQDWLDTRAEKREERREKRREALATELDSTQEQHILDFVDAMGRPVGRRLVALGLRGSRAKIAQKRGIPNNPQYGALKGVPELALLQVIDAMLDDGRLVRKGRKYPTVWMPDKPVRSATKSASKPRRSSKGPLHDALRNYRRRAARKRRWKPYQVFPNKALDAMIAERPRTLGELGAIPGIGPSRLDKFGDEILAILRNTPER